MRLFEANHLILISVFAFKLWAGKFNNLARTSSLKRNPVSLTPSERLRLTLRVWALMRCELGLLLSLFRVQITRFDEDYPDDLLRFTSEELARKPSHLLFQLRIVTFKRCIRIQLTRKFGINFGSGQVTDTIRFHGLI